jgi:hypothetical protein
MFQPIIPGQYHDTPKGCRDGEPDTAMAVSLRQIIQQDEMLARVPTSEEYDFLIAQRKELGYGKGFPVR